MNKGTTILDQLPDRLSVTITKGKSGAFIGEIAELGVFTEVDDLKDLDFNINDLVFTYFDLPKKYYSSIWYKPTHPIVQHQAPAKTFSPYNFQVFVSPSLVR